MQKEYILCILVLLIFSTNSLVSAPRKYDDTIIYNYEDYSTKYKAEWFNTSNWKQYLFHTIPPQDKRLIFNTDSFPISPYCGVDKKYQYAIRDEILDSNGKFVKFADTLVTADTLFIDTSISKGLKAIRKRNFLLSDNFCCEDGKNSDPSFFDFMVGFRVGVDNTLINPEDNIQNNPGGVDSFWVSPRYIFGASIEKKIWSILSNTFLLYGQLEGIVKSGGKGKGLMDEINWQPEFGARATLKTVGGFNFTNINGGGFNLSEWIYAGAFLSFYYGYPFGDAYNSNCEIVEQEDKLNLSWGVGAYLGKSVLNWLGIGENVRIGFEYRKSWVTSPTTYNGADLSPSIREYSISVQFPLTWASSRANEMAQICYMHEIVEEVYLDKDTVDIGKGSVDTPSSAILVKNIDTNCLSIRDAIKILKSDGSIAGRKICTTDTLFFFPQAYEEFGGADTANTTNIDILNGFVELIDSLDSKGIKATVSVKGGADPTGKDRSKNNSLAKARANNTIAYLKNNTSTSNSNFIKFNQSSHPILTDGSREANDKARHAIVQINITDIDNCDCNTDDRNTFIDWWLNGKPIGHNGTDKTTDIWNICFNENEVEDVVKSARKLNDEKVNYEIIVEGNNSNLCKILEIRKSLNDSGVNLQTNKDNSNSNCAVDEIYLNDKIEYIKIRFVKKKN